jgi:hypothetical protein
MKCEDCLSLIEEYFDAELNQQESAKVAEHLTACEICNEVYLSIEQEQQLYVHYQRDVEVTPALWQAVEASIKQESAHQKAPQSAGILESLRRFFTETFHAPRFSPALAAMLVVVAVGATVLVMNYVNSSSTTKTIIADENKNSNGTNPINNSNENAAPQSGGGIVADSNSNTTPEKEVIPTPVPQPEREIIAQPKTVKDTKPYAADLRQAVGEKMAKTQPNTTAEALLRDAEQKYIKAIAILQRDFDKRRSKLDPQLVAKLENSLASIDRTIAETRKAVQQNAGDPIAVQYMLTAYAKKVEVLRDVTAD